MTISFTSITVAELQALEQKIYQDILAGGNVMSYTIRDQTFMFQSLQQVQDFLKFIQSEIVKRQSGGSFSLARFSGL